MKVHLLCASVIHGDSNLALGLALFGGIARCTLAEVRTARRSDTPQLITADRVALDRCRPRAPTDPYVLALACVRGIRPDFGFSCGKKPETRSAPRFPSAAMPDRVYPIWHFGLTEAGSAPDGISLRRRIGSHPMANCGDRCRDQFSFAGEETERLSYQECIDN